jgi:hypothetical protein
MSVVDWHGTVQPTDDITMNSITASTINVTGHIQQSNIIANTINTASIITDNVDVSLIGVIHDISAHTIVTDTLNTPTLRTECFTANTLTTPVLNAEIVQSDDIVGDSATYSLFIQAANVNGGAVNVTDVTAKTPIYLRHMRALRTFLLRQPVSPC